MTTSKFMRYPLFSFKEYRDIAGHKKGSNEPFQSFIRVRVVAHFVVPSPYNDPD